MSVKGKEKFEEEKKEARGGVYMETTNNAMAVSHIFLFTPSPSPLQTPVPSRQNWTWHIFKRLSKMTLGANDSMPTVTRGLVLSVCACCEAGCKPGNLQADPNKVKGR